MRTTIRKRLLNITIVVVFAFCWIMGSVHITGLSHAKGSDYVVDSDRVTFVGFSSDIHAQSGGESVDRLENWLDNVSEKCGEDLDEMAFAGDMASSSVSSSVFWVYAQKAMSEVKTNENVDGEGFCICGNHEYYPGEYTHKKNKTTKLYKDAGEYKDYGDYILYSMSSRQYDEIYQDEDIEAMKEFLEDKSSYDKPIFILGHFPLHTYNGFSGEDSDIHSGRAAVGSKKIIDALNSASEENGQTIVFIWGHNHNRSNDYYDEVYTERINDYHIDFTYASAGCMSDYEYGKGMGVNVKGKGLVAALRADSMILTYYTASAKAVSSTTVPYNGRTMEMVTVRATAGANGSISPSGNDVQIIRNGNKTFRLTPDDGYMVDKVTVNDEEVPFSDNRYIMTDAQGDESLQVTFKPGPVTDYVLADSFEMGKTYLIVNADSGEGQALTNSRSDSFEIAPVSISNGKINANNLNKGEWKVKAISDSELIGLFNGYNVLKVNTGGTSDPYIHTSSTGYSAGGLEYTENNHILFSYGSKQTYYYIGSDTTNGFRVKSSESNLGKVYIFVKVKSDQNAPAAPTVSSENITANKVILNAITTTGYGDVQYAKNTQNIAPEEGWQTEVEFTGLMANTTYYFFAKYAGNDYYNVSPASEALAVTTIGSGGGGSSGGDSSDTPTTDSVQQAKDNAYTVMTEVENNVEYKYREEEQDEAYELIATYRTKINAATTEKEINALLEEFFTGIDKIITRADYEKVEMTETTLNSVKAGKKKATIRWTIDNKTFDGYSIAYKQKGKYWRYMNVTDNTKSSLTIKKLKKGKKYSFKVRGYKVLKDAMIYGCYSATYTRKIK